MHEGGARGCAAIGGFFVNYFLFFGFLRSFSVLINPIVTTYNVSYMGASSVPGACCMGLTAGMAFGPALLAKAGLRRTSLLVGWVPAACWLLMYTFLNFPILIVSFLGMALAWGIIFIMCLNSMSLHFDENRTLATQIGTLGTSVGQFAFPVIITPLVAAYSLKGFFLITSGIFANHLPALLLFMNTTKLNLPKELTDEKQEIVGECVNEELSENDVVITTNIVPSVDQNEIKQKVSFLKSSSYFVYIVQQICLNVGVACGCLYTAAHVVKVSDADEMKAAFLISLQGGIEACVRIPFGYLADRPFINKLYLLGFVCLNLGICFAVVGWSDSVFSLGAALCYGGFFTGAFGGISFTGLAEIAKKYDSSDDLMKGLGISSALNSIMTLIVSAICGKVTDIYDSYIPTFYFAAILLLISAFLSVLVGLMVKHR